MNGLGLVYAPNANVRLSGSGTIKGAIIGKQFSMTSGNRVIFTIPNGELMEMYFPDEGGAPTIEQVLPTVNPIRERN